MVISDELRQSIEADCARYPQKRGGLLPALHRVQAETGYISPEVASELAAIFEIRPVEVMEVVHFYNMFHATPQGRHHVHVCTNLPCSLRGARSLMRRIETHLGIHAGETTSDGRITLGHEECLGACAYAPMMRVDDDYHEDLDFEKVREVLDALE
jgi:NADH-quinone oxidoreductase subunit E